MEERQDRGALKPFIWFATIVCLYQIAVVGNLAAMAGFFVPQHVHRANSLAAALAVIFLMLPLFGARKGHGMSSKGDGDGPSLLARIPDVVLLASALIGLAYVIVFNEEVIEYSEMGFLDTKGMIFAASSVCRWWRRCAAPQG